MTTISTVKSNASSDHNNQILNENDFSDESLIQKANDVSHIGLDAAQELKITEYLEQIQQLREQMAKLKQTQEFIGFE